MEKLSLPWVLRGTDFSRSGWHAEPTAAFQLMFEFLRLSPTYELARKERLGKLTADDRRTLPADFSEALKTYDLLGDVNCVLFRAWWLKRGLKVFGNSYSKPKVHLVSLLTANEEASLEQLKGDLDRNLSDQRRDEGLNSSLLLSVPINLKTSDALKQIKKILSENRNGSHTSTQQPKLRLHGKRFHATAMFRGLRLMWIKAAKPSWELWRLGTHSKYSGSYSNVLDTNAPKKIANPTDVDDRQIITKITFRALNKFQLITENAARGKFPCTDDVELGNFDYVEISKRLLIHARWIKSEKQRLRPNPKN
jgi:hypothetical protein